MAYIVRAVTRARSCTAATVEDMYRRRFARTASMPRRHAEEVIVPSP
jgi:hypothetical protein